MVAHYQILNIFQWGRCWWKSSFYWGKIGRTLPKFKHFSMGAMLMKIVILLKENWSHITKFWIFLNWSHMDYFFNADMLMKIIIYEKKLVAHGHISLIWFDRGTMRENWRFSKRETTYGGVQTLSWGRCSWTSSFYWRKKIAHSQILMSKYYLMILFLFNSIFAYKTCSVSLILKLSFGMEALT